jgi:hypothetical protein
MLALARAVPQVQDVGFASGEVTGVCCTNLVSLTTGHELFFGELANRL